MMGEKLFGGRGQVIKAGESAGKKSRGLPCGSAGMKGAANKAE